MELVSFVSLNITFRFVRFVSFRFVSSNIISLLFFVQFLRMGESSVVRKKNLNLDPVIRILKKMFLI